MSTTEQNIVKLIECPRDAMQGISAYIPAEKKADYINQLLLVGFDTIDFGSFVSPKAVPQMSDTIDVLKMLNLNGSRSKLLAIIANIRGAEEASQFDQIRYLGFPLSLSETFQQRNTNKGIEDAFEIVNATANICQKKGKELVVYLSMGFGNPYGDPYSPEFVLSFTKKLNDCGVKIISLSDTVGVGDVKIISELFSTLIPSYPGIEFGAHLHSAPDSVKLKLDAAYDAGCRRFDSAIKGFGGCPMAKDDLVGNLPTERIIKYLKAKDARLNINENELEKSISLSSTIFPPL